MTSEDKSEQPVEPDTIEKLLQDAREARESNRLASLSESSFLRGPDPTPGLLRWLVVTKMQDLHRRAEALGIPLQALPAFPLKATTNADEIETWLIDFERAVTAKPGDDADEPADAKSGDLTSQDADEFPPMEWVDPDPPHTRYDFGARKLLWELWRALRKARRRLTPDDLPDHVPTWKESGVTGDNLKQALSNLRDFWKGNNRTDLANRIDNAGGSVRLR